MSTAVHILKPPEPQKTCSRFPGIAYTHWSLIKKTEVMDLIKARVIYVSPRIQWLKPEAKFTGYWNGGIQHLGGDAYLYWCPKCQRSATQFELPKYDALIAGGLTFEEAVGAPRCPICFKVLDDLKVGDKVVMHFRYASDGIRNGRTRSGAIRWEIAPSWSGWYAERMNW